MTIEEMIKKVEKFRARYPKAETTSLRNNKQVILSLQRDQLLAGQTNEGKKLSPTYTSDPFFKTKKSADSYAARKRAKEQRHAAMIRYNLFAPKDSNTPNLIFANSLNASQFQRKLRVNITENKLTIISVWSRAKNVEKKYPKALGLNKTSAKFLWNYTVREDLVDYWNNLR